MHASAAGVADPCMGTLRCAGETSASARPLSASIQRAWSSSDRADPIARSWRRPVARKCPRPCSALCTERVRARCLRPCSVWDNCQLSASRTRAQPCMAVADDKLTNFGVHGARTPREGAGGRAVRTGHARTRQDTRSMRSTQSRTAAESGGLRYCPLRPPAHSLASWPGALERRASGRGPQVRSSCHARCQVPGASSQSPSLRTGWRILWSVACAFPLLRTWPTTSPAACQLPAASGAVASRRAGTRTAVLASSQASQASRAGRRSLHSDTPCTPCTPATLATLALIQDSRRSGARSRGQRTSAPQRAAGAGRRRPAQGPRTPAQASAGGVRHCPCPHPRGVLAAQAGVWVGPMAESRKTALHCIVLRCVALHSGCWLRGCPQATETHGTQQTQTNTAIAATRQATECDLRRHMHMHRAAPCAARRAGSRRAP